MNYVIFDLAGTLTDTLQDLCNSVNHALREMGWPVRTLAEVRSFVGNGVRRLVERAVPPTAQTEDRERCFACFQRHYLEHCQDNTRLYPGIADMLCELRDRGVRMAIVSNKLQAGVDELCQRFFPGLVDVAVGQREAVPLKPAPDMVRLAMREIGATPESTLYVGDSEVDVMTARNAGLPLVAVLWGFRDREQLVKAGAATFVTHPRELLDIIK